MSKVPKLRVVSKTAAGPAAGRGLLGDLPDHLTVELAGIAEVARDGLMAVSVAAGLAVAQALFDEELESVCGPRGRHDADRTAVRHGSEAGSVVLGGRRLAIAHPRARTTDGHEVPLATYRFFADDDQLTAVVLERMLAGVATRRHAAVADPVGEQAAAASASMSRSAISRRFVAATEKALAELMSRPLPDDIKILLIDGEHFGEHCCLVSLVITADGTKIPAGIWEGSSENKTVVRALLADLISRGLAFDDGLLVVIDGGKGLRAAAREVLGTKAAVQRCTLHKRRNVAEHLPKDQQAWVDAKLVRAFFHPDPAQGLASARALATTLGRDHPGAAASLREGLEEMFTVSRLGIDGRLLRSLCTSNAVESMISVARATNRNVTNWKDGKMILRWAAAGMLNAERSFRRIKGYRQMPQLVKALHRHAHPDDPATTAAFGAETVGAVA